ncbi:MAG: hypothetical protein IJK62_00260 [Bacteroidales bacterium]|nr:hypothetical protein [Bacteroidales bacterium]
MAKQKTKIKDYDVVNDFDRPTPILRGEDAVRFMLEMERQNNPTPAMLKARKKAREKRRKLLEKYKKNFNGLI